MTANQIAYAKHKEDVRHNVETERQNLIHLRHEHTTSRASKTQAEAAISQAETAAGKLAEDSRKNRANEQINWWYNSAMANEVKRHNLETETTNRFQADSLREYQLKQGEALLRNAAVAERNATVNERELENSSTRARASLTSANAAWVNAQTSRANVQELIRSNKANEAMRAADYASQASYRQQQADLGFATLEEDTRWHTLSNYTNTINANAARIQAKAQEEKAKNDTSRVTYDNAAKAGSTVRDMSMGFVNVVSGIQRLGG